MYNLLFFFYYYYFILFFLPFILFIFLGKGRPSVMGNTESMQEESQDYFFRQPPSYAGSSMNSNYDYQQTPYSGSGSSGNTSHEYEYQRTPSYVGTGSSVKTNHQHKQQPTYIADNFSSLDQVFNITYLHSFRKTTSISFITKWKTAFSCMCKMTVDINQFNILTPLHIRKSLECSLMKSRILMIRK